MSRLLFLSSLVCVSLLLSACSSVPTSSLWKLATTDETDLVAIDAKQVRARITLDEPAKLKLKNVRLALNFEYEGEQETAHSFILDLLTAGAVTEKAGWFSDEIRRHQYLFKISEESIPAFKKYQREFLKYGRPKKYHWTIYYHLLSSPHSGQPLFLDLELKLAQREEFFYLLKQAAVEVDAAN